jgi:ribonucleoside-diphosphate reductase alpha chain
MVTSCADAVAKSLEKFNRFTPVNGIECENEDAPVKISIPKKMFGTCPDCGSSIQHEEGCLKCSACGWSKC